MRVLSFAIRFDRGLLLLAVVASVAAGGAGAGLMGYIGSQFARQDRIGPVEIVAFVGLTLFSLAAGLGARWILVRLVGRRLLRLQMELSRRLLGTDLPTLEDIGSARLLAVMTDDARSISEAMIRIPDLVISTALIAGCFAYLAWLSPLAVAVLVVIALPVVLLYRRFHRRLQRLLGRFFAIRDVRYRQYQALTEGPKELQVDRTPPAPVPRRSPRGQGRGVPAAPRRQVVMANEVANSWSQTAYFVFVFALLVMIRGDYVERGDPGGLRPDRPLHSLGPDPADRRHPDLDPGRPGPGPGRHPRARRPTPTRWRPSAPRTTMHVGERQIRTRFRSRRPFGSRSRTSRFRYTRRG